MAAFVICCQFIVYICIYRNYIIATESLNIDGLKNCFKGRETFETNDIVKFYRQREPSAPISTINWRIYLLVKKNVLSRVGRGRFTLGERKKYLPVISPEIKSLHRKLQKEFPYLKLCIWDTSVFNEFMIHQPGRFFTLIEVEKDATQPVFFYLKEKKHSVFIEPTNDIFDKYLPDEKMTIIVKSLVSEAPLQVINGINYVTIEKMLVDIFCDDVVFSAQQGSEMRRIFIEAISKYGVNENRMLRYANRRRKKVSFKNYLNSLSNLRQQS